MISVSSKNSNRVQTCTLVHSVSTGALSFRG